MEPPRALICPGGANHGAYQAGAICGLATHQGLRDGEPLPYELVCGASSGAINAYFAATAQYERLAAFWQALPARLARVPRLRSRVLTAIAVVLGLAGGRRGLIGGRVFAEIVRRYTSDPPAIRIPLFLSATNLTRENAEIFRFRASAGSATRGDRALDEAIGCARLPRITTLDPTHVGLVLLASCALPLAFAPVAIPTEPGGELDEYADGGLTDNAPFDVPGAYARTLDTILTNPLQAYSERHPRFRDAFEVGIGTYRAMERRLLWLQDARLQDPALTVRVVAPARALPGRYLDFTDRRAFAESFALGRRDGERGFVPHRLS